MTRLAITKHPAIHKKGGMLFLFGQSIFDNGQAFPGFVIGGEQDTGVDGGGFGRDPGLPGQGEGPVHVIIMGDKIDVLNTVRSEELFGVLQVFLRIGRFFFQKQILGWNPLLHQVSFHPFRFGDPVVSDAAGTDDPLDLSFVVQREGHLQPLPQRRARLAVPEGCSQHQSRIPRMIGHSDIIIAGGLHPERG